MKLKVMIAFTNNIQWVTDGDKVELPSKMRIPKDVESQNYISNELSNLYGYLHEGFTFQI